MSIECSKCPACDCVDKEVDEAAEGVLAFLRGYAEELREQLDKCMHLDEVQNLSASVLGNAGMVSQILRTLVDYTPDQRRVIGNKINHIVNEFKAAIATRKKLLQTKGSEVNYAARNLQNELIEAFKDKKDTFLGIDKATLNVIQKFVAEKERKNRHTLNIKKGISVCPRCGYPNSLKAIMPVAGPCPYCGWEDSEAKTMRALYRIVMEQLDTKSSSDSITIEAGVLKVLLSWMNEH